MKRLYLLRHAKSSWDDPALDDHDRPLAPRGRKAAKRIARELRRRGIEIDLVLCSTARRTRETLELVESALSAGVPIEIEPELYAAPADRLLTRLETVPEAVESVLVVAHNPGLQDFSLRLAPDSSRITEKFPTGALAAFELDAERWGEAGASASRLAFYLVPRELTG